MNRFIFEKPAAATTHSMGQRGAIAYGLPVWKRDRKQVVGAIQITPTMQTLSKNSVRVEVFSVCI